MRKLTDLETNIIKELKLISKPYEITIIDSIKLILDLLGENKINKIITITNLTETERFYCNLINDKNNILYLSITNNYFNNILLELYFILSNPFLYTDIIFTILLENTVYLEQIPNIINILLDKVYNSPYRKYFNNYIMKKWKEVLNFKKITFEDYVRITKNQDINIYNNYDKIYNIFNICVEKIKLTTNKYIELYKDLNQVPGCINISKDFYIYCVKLHTGLEIRSINKIFRWGVKEVKKIKSIMHSVIDNLHPEVTDKKFKQKIDYVNSLEKYKYKNKEEFIEDHNNKLKEIEEVLVNKLKLPLAVPAKIVDFDEVNMADGYWFRDAFYLNTHNWKKCEKFSVKSLVLHETIPGHHMQICYDVHKDANETLLSYWFPSVINGFCEGWGLFSEKLGFNYSQEDYLGILSYNMLRSLRIVADIAIHYYGIDPEDIIKLYHNYLPVNENSIRTEVYRYVCQPGQALSYKIGDLIFKKIFATKFNRKDRLLDADAIEFYKEIITSGAIPLELLCKKYNIDTSLLF